MFCLVFHGLRQSHFLSSSKLNLKVYLFWKFFPQEALSIDLLLFLHLSSVIHSPSVHCSLCVRAWVFMWTLLSTVFYFGERKKSVIILHVHVVHDVLNHYFLVTVSFVQQYGHAKASRHALEVKFIIVNIKIFLFKI